MPRLRLRLGTAGLFVVIIALTLALIIQWRREADLRAGLVRKNQELFYAQSTAEMHRTVAMEVEAELRKARVLYEQGRAEKTEAGAARSVGMRQLAVAVVKTADPKAGPESAVYAVVETGPDGKPVGVLICSDLESLRRLLAWARRDPSAGWRVVVRPSGTSLEAQANDRAFGAALVAGFEGVDYAADPAEAETAAALDRLGWKYPCWKGP